MIELRHLRYFVVVAEELNFRRAAERVHIDQTPLSRTIRDLEDQLGVQLFVRAPRQLHLTPAGLCLLKEVRKVFIRVERTYRVVRETDARFRAPLRIGVAGNWPPDWWPTELASDAPGISGECAGAGVSFKVRRCAALGRGNLIE